MPRENLEGEQVLARWELKMKGGAKALLVLTNLRVWREVEARGAYDLTSLAVDEVQWASVGRRHSPLLLVLAVILLLLGGAGAAGMDSASPLGGAIVFALILGIIYLLTRRGEVVIGGGTALIRQPIGGAEQDRNAALAFVGQIESRALSTRARPA